MILYLSGTALAEPGSDSVSFSSGESRVALIELYTSEGCSSCPPADRWLSNLKGNSGLWTDFVPIALHVDYWNHIGWHDRFSRRDYSDRQRRYIAEGGASVVYTPGVFRDGQEWRRWRFGRPGAADEEIVGDLTVRINDRDVEVHFAAGNEHDLKMTVHIAVLGMNLETQVSAGENSGRTLRHDFVALGVVSAPLKTHTGAYRAVAMLPAAGMQHDDLAIAAWVSGAKNQAPIQAVGGYLPGHN